MLAQRYPEVRDGCPGVRADPMRLPPNFLPTSLHSICTAITCKCRHTSQNKVKQQAATERALRRPALQLYESCHRRRPFFLLQPLVNHHNNLDSSNQLHQPPFGLPLNVPKTVRHHQDQSLLLHATSYDLSFNSSDSFDSTPLPHTRCPIS